MIGFLGLIVLKIILGTAQAAIGDVLALLGIKWFDHVLVVTGLASSSEIFKALARPDLLAYACQGR